jgi:ADP-heptose:LPS heptosyltransferase
LRRSFAGVNVRPRGIDDDAVLAEVDVAAYYETIAFHLAKTPEEVLRSFVTLRPDASRVASIRQRYHRIIDRPLIGISWWSANKKKDLPALEDWAPLLRRKEAGIVSLQHGDIEHDLKVLQDLADGPVIHDAEIDQFADLDGFAAQIAALDAIVSISNTTIDIAGMLGVPTVHICDDRFPSFWPPSSPPSWYPGMVFVYKQHRSWSDVLAEAAKRLEHMVSTPAP